MTVPTQPVTIDLADFGGEALEGVTVTARLSDVDYTVDGVFVSTEPVTGVTDVNGQVILELFPNALVPDGLGSVGTTIRVTAQIPNSRPLDVLAVIPDEPCNLVDCLVDEQGSAGAVYSSLSRDWARKVDGPVDGSEFSAKEYAQGTQASTGGSAKNWAQQAGAVTGASANDRSSKSWAQADLSGATLGGSAKDWAASASLPDGTNKSAKSYAADAQGSASSAASSASAASTSAGAASTSAGAAATSAGAAATSATAAASSATSASASQTSASGSETAAAASATQAGLYAVTSATGAKFYDTIALGRAAVADGFTFGVKAGGSDGLVDASIYRRDSAGTETFIARLVQASFITSPDYTVDPDALVVVLAQDDEGRVALGVHSDGEVEAGYFRSRFLNGARVQNIIDAAGLDGGTYSAEVNFIINAGQSNAEGTGGNPLTTVQEYDSVGFPPKTLNPVAFAALTVANTGVSSSESPMYGTLGFIKELIAKERGLSYATHGYQLAGTNTGYSGFAIAALNKGTTPYNVGINHVTYGYSLSQTAGKTFKGQAVTWSQGEAETGAMTRASYNALEKQLATDYDTDIRAVTGQTDSVIFITWQVNSVNVLTVGLAQMDAHEESSLVYCACPSYFLGFDDNVHLSYYGYKWLGAYYALVYQRVKVDGLTWEPLKPLSATRQGAIANVLFNKSGLVLDTSTVPAQTNYGFTLVDSGGSPLTISSVTLLPGDRIKVVAASSIPAGAKLRYACNVATGMGTYVGGAGNLRDSQGDEIFYDAIAMPMHNWCVAAEIALP